MKFGILHWNTYTADYPVEKQFQEIVELARATRDAEFDLFGTTHGHLQSPIRGFHPLLMLGALAPETGNMSLLTGVFQLALNNPVDMAEQTATLEFQQICSDEPTPEILDTWDRLGKAPVS